MGCFSFICKECGKPILSNSFRGEMVRLFLLEEGKIIEAMEGEYDSYGCVFDENFDSREWKSYPWSDCYPGVSEDEKTVCTLMHNDDEGSGIAAIHSKCFKKYPDTKSEDDPNQGWGDFGLPGEELEVALDKSPHVEK